MSICLVSQYEIWTAFLTIITCRHSLTITRKWYTDTMKIGSTRCRLWSMKATMRHDTVANWCRLHESTSSNSQEESLNKSSKRWWWWLTAANICRTILTRAPSDNDKPEHDSFHLSLSKCEFIFHLKWGLQFSASLSLSLTIPIVSSSRITLFLLMRSYSVHFWNGMSLSCCQIFFCWRTYTFEQSES
jgi:hypothetical protein